jgi:hypothetical protein
MPDWLAEIINRAGFVNDWAHAGKGKATKAALFDGWGGYKQHLKSYLGDVRRGDFDYNRGNWPATSTAEDIYNRAVVFNPDTGVTTKGNMVFPSLDNVDDYSLRNNRNNPDLKRLMDQALNDEAGIAKEFKDANIDPKDYRKINKVVLNPKGNILGETAWVDESWKPTLEASKASSRKFYNNEWAKGNLKNLATSLGEAAKGVLNHPATRVAGRMLAPLAAAATVYDVHQASTPLNELGLPTEQQMTDQGMLPSAAKERYNQMYYNKFGEPQQSSLGVLASMNNYPN